MSRSLNAKGVASGRSRFGTPYDAGCSSRTPQNSREIRENIDPRNISAIRYLASCTLCV